MSVKGSMELKYAEQFSVDYCENGCSLVDINGDKFLIVPEGESVPDDTSGMTVIKQPINNIYVAATSSMDLFDSIGKLGNVTMTFHQVFPVTEIVTEDGDIYEVRDPAPFFYQGWNDTNRRATSLVYGFPNAFHQS